MKTENTLLRALSALACLLILAGCTETRFEEATGEGPVRGINAVVELDDVAFRIEEFTLGIVPFKDSSPTANYDNLSYTFNFDLSVPGETTPRRLASRSLDVVDQQDYTFVLTGDAASQDIILWERAVRTWNGDETIFDVNVAHLNTTLGPVDVYLVPTGQAVDPTTLVGTVSFGERLDAVEADGDDYQVIVTPENLPGDILFQSVTFNIQPAQSYTVAVFDTDPSITNPVSVRLFNEAGVSLEISDERFPGTMQFVHASFGLGNIDVAFDGDFTDLAVTNLAYGEDSADVEAPSEVVPYSYVPTGNTMALLEENNGLALGTRDMIVLAGTPDNLSTIRVDSLRRGFSTAAQLRLINTVTNFDLVNIYVNEPGTDINDVNPSFFAAPFGFTLVTKSEPGDFQITVTGLTDRIPLATEVITFNNNDILEIILLDDADPNAVRIQSFSNVNP